MASLIEVTRDVVYELAGEKQTIPADSIVQLAPEVVEAPEFKEGNEIETSLFTGTTAAGPVVWRVTADYSHTTKSIDEIDLVKCPVGIEIIQGLTVEIVEADDEDAAY
ncbi:MAG: hypothetical protein ACOH2R_28560 [Pseudomonas sp.]